MKKHYNIGKMNPRWGTHPNHKGKNNPNYKTGNTLKIPKCSDCGKKLIKYTAKRCRPCASRHQLKQYNHLRLVDKSGKNNPMFGKNRSGKNNSMFGKKQSKISKKKMSLAHGGTGRPYEHNEYNRNIFTNELKEFIRKRDGFKCQNCKKSQKQEFKKLKRRLTIHHIDYNKQNCKKNNLITLCHECNIKANKNRKFYKIFYTQKVISRD